jgi:hypothetical protein
VIAEETDSQPIGSDASVPPIGWSSVVLAAGAQARTLRVGDLADCAPPLA